jgi:hypothetical protein
MTSTPVRTRALALDLGHADTGEFLGVALTVPSERYLAILHDGAERAQEQRLAAETWREIDQWGAAGDAGLPARPSPIPVSIGAAVVEGDRPSVVARRVASIPINVSSRADLPALTERVLPQLLRGCRSAA